GHEGIALDGQPGIVRPAVITIEKIAKVAEAVNGEFAMWVRVPKNRRAIPHRLEECGYTPVRNKNAKDGLWKIRGRRQTVYAQSHMTPRDKMEQIRKLIEANQ